MVERNAKINELVYLRDVGAIQLEVTVCRCVKNSTFGWAPSVSEVYRVGVSQFEHQLDFCGGSEGVPGAGALQACSGTTVVNKGV
jgi:hypothetical protein